MTFYRRLTEAQARADRAEASVSKWQRRFDQMADTATNYALQLEEAKAELAAIKAALDTPEQEDFLTASVAEAKYQRTRWAETDAEKTDSDWFWLVGYLVSKAMHDVRGKRVHHLTAAGAVLANWHAAAIERGEAMPEERGNQADHTGRITA